MEEITVILNVFKRPHTLIRQLKALEEQTVKPTTVLIWQNSGAKKSVKEIISSLDYIPSYEVVYSTCSNNLGVWARFAYALNARTKFLCVFDDDVIPGSNWFKNCIDTYNKKPGLLGTRGVRFFSENRYTPIDHFGWGNPNEDIVEVDIVGHAWFFTRDMLQLYWAHLPPVNFPSTAGEDMHFSYVLQKAGIKTYVPPHNIDDKSLWGNTALEECYGSDENAISLSSDAYVKFDKCLSYYTQNGFNIYYKRNSSNKSTNAKIILNSNALRRIGIADYIKNNKMIYSYIKPFILWLRKYGIHL